jgi:hypothetical protein
MRRFILKAKAALFVVMLAACTGNDVTAPVPASARAASDAALLRGTVSGLLGTVDGVLGQLLPAITRTTPLLNSAVVTKTIGPEGGVIRSAGVELRVPRGALRTSVAITMVVPSGSYVEAQFFPHGLVFREPVTVRFNTSATSAAGATSGSVVGTYFTLPILRGLISPDETYEAVLVDGSIEFRIRHFSAYAPAFRRGYTAAGN